MSFTSQSSWLVTFFTLVFLTVAIGLSTADKPMSERHEKWMTQYGRVYKDAEEKARRFEIFKANAEYVQSVNHAGNRTYWLGLNQFADLNDEEFKASFLGYKPNSLVANEMLNSFSSIFHFACTLIRPFFFSTFYSTSTIISALISTIEKIKVLSCTLILIQPINYLHACKHCYLVSIDIALMSYESICNS
jgi:Cathepsin propeptide inhibitor domain (I29)